MSDLFRLDGKVVAVIGAGSGIGEAVAQGAAEQGAHVFCLDVATPAAFATAERIRHGGGRADGGAADVTDRDSLDATLEYVADAGARLDAVVCTPGVNVRKRLVDYANKSILKRWASADEMVGPTLFLISDAASYVTGTILFADGGWLAADGRFTPPGI